MIECETVTREWGNSIGITLPKDLLEKEHIGKDEKVKVLVVKQSDVLKKTFGLFKGKLKKSGQEMKDQARAELYREMR